MPVVSGATPSKIIPNLIEYNTGNMWEAGNGRFVLPINGLYSITATLTLSNRSNANTVLCSIRRNGAAILFQTAVFVANININYVLTQGDIIEIFASCPTGGATHVISNNENHLSLSLIH